MASQGKEVLLPQRSDSVKFNLKSFTKVKVILIDGHTYVGYVDKEHENPGFLSLFAATALPLEPSEEEGEKCGTLRFETNEIQQVLVLSEAEEVKKETLEPIKSDVPLERVYSTDKIETVEQMERLVHVLSSMPKGEMGLNAYGINVGRSGEVGWICLYIENTLVVIDVITVENLMPNFWNLMGSSIFENEKLEKVIYNTRPISDYLFHLHGIQLKNAFDIQVSAFYLWASSRNKKWIKETSQQNSSRVKYQLLSEILQEHLDDDVLKLELSMLRDFEKKDFSLRSTLMTRPEKNIDPWFKKAIALDLKYLLNLKATLKEKINSKLMECINSQINAAVNGSSGDVAAQLENPLRVPEKVMTSIVGPSGERTIKRPTSEPEPKQPQVPKEKEKVAKAAKKEGDPKRSDKWKIPVVTLDY